jgi:hypothetical protein
MKVTPSENMITPIIRHCLTYGFSFFPVIEQAHYQLATAAALIYWRQTAYPVRLMGYFSGLPYCIV